MPLKDINWGQARIGLFDKETGEWKELGEARISESILEGDDLPYTPVMGVFHFTCSLKNTRKQLRLLRQALGFGKRPKCTYKTVRRDCAKRNRYK